MAAFGLTIIQINLHHSKSASAVLQKNIAVMHTGISLIQEPWINRDVIRGLGGAGISCYRYPQASNPRTCILAKNVKIVPLLDLCSRDLMVASVDLIGIGKLVIGSAYFPHDRATHPPEEVRSLVDYCKVRGLPLLLGCDANSHHELWGSTDTNRRGEDLVDYLITTDLDILNIGTVPTFRNSVRQEAIDITLWFQTNPLYLTTCKYCTNWNHTHSMAPHGSETRGKKTGSVIPQTYKLHSTGKPWKSKT